MPKGVHEPALGSSVILGCLGPVSICPSVSGVRFLGGPARAEDSFRSDHRVLSPPVVQCLCLGIFSNLLRLVWLQDT